MSKLKPNYEQVQAHYDLSNEFYALFLDPLMVYSCAYFERDGMSLEEAQVAKIDLSLGKCEIDPGMRVLDIGCGWGAVMHRAVEHYGAEAVGLTLSKEQAALAAERLAPLGDRAVVRLQGWEEFDEPVDRIVSIGAFEHFKQERFDAFFQKCHELLPPGAPMLLHSITWPEPEFFLQEEHNLTHDDVIFVKFMSRTIFPGGDLRPASLICSHAEAAGFRVERQQSLPTHYALTLEKWAANLEAARERAIEITSEEIYSTYMRYLTGCASYFRRGYINVVQFSLRKT